jgi:DDE superfamily endonuclease
VRAEVIRLACERPADNEVPLAHWSSTELARAAVTRGICEQISGVTVWRWLSQDAIKPWQYRSWIFPRDPDFTANAGRILDLYGGRWEGELLHPGHYVVCCDEKPSIQARARRHATMPAAPGVRRGQRVEHEYERKGALCYLAAWDARRARLFDRCAPKDGIVPFDQLVEQFMSVEPYSKAQRVFVIVDNGSAHRGQKSIKRLQGAWPNLALVHTPVHASWLNQAEIYFSIVQRKVLTPNHFPDLDTLEQQLLGSAAATSRSQPHSNGSSPAPTSTASRTDSTYPPPKPPDPNTSANFRARALRTSASVARVRGPCPNCQLDTEVRKWMLFGRSGGLPFRALAGGGGLPFRARWLL